MFETTSSDFYFPRGNDCRFSLREKPAFRGAKSDNRMISPETDTVPQVKIAKAANDTKVADLLHSFVFFAAFAVESASQVAAGNDRQDAYPTDVVM